MLGCFFAVFMDFDRNIIPLVEIHYIKTILLLTHECSTSCLSMFIFHGQINNLSVFAPGFDSPAFVVELQLNVIPLR